MKKPDETVLRRDFRNALDQDRNPEAVISAILELLINESHSSFELKKTFIVVKEELIAYFYGQSISAEILFNKMWRHGNRLIRQMSTFLIPIFFKPNNFQELKNILPPLRILSNMQFTRLIGYNLAQVLKRRPQLAVSLLRILASSENMWERILALELCKQLNSNQIPEINILIKTLKNDSELILKNIHISVFRQIRIY